MKTQRILFSILAIFAVTMGILLDASPAQATEVIRDGDTALGIRGLTVKFADGSEAVYDVNFVFRSPQGLYGDPPGLFDFSGQGQAEDAILAANAALNAAGTPLVGPLDSYFYSVGYNYLDSALDGPVVRAAQALSLGVVWPTVDRDLEEVSLGWGDPNSYAEFVEVSEPPGNLPPKVITDVDGNVTRIENLLVLDEIGVTKLYNVDFDYDSAINVYPEGEFDFPASADALAASLAVRDALNAEDTIPPGAGSEGTDQFFIGSMAVQFGIVLAVGSENLTGVWDDCETECFGSVAALDPDDPFTYAKFTETQDVPPGPATLISPSGAIIENIPTYTWNAVADSTWYYLTVKDDTGEVIIGKEFTASGAGCGDGTGQCSVTLEVELADGLYQWLIQTYNEFGEGPLSDEMSFTVDTTGEKPEPATLISPSGTITENNPTYTWDAVANSAWYRLWVEDSTQTKIIDQWYTAEEAGCSDTTVQCSLTPETVLADDSHQWWIRTWNDNGFGDWSDEMSFTVDTSVPPGKATLIAPSGDITDNTPTYTWNAVADSTWYRFFVWDSTQTEIIDQWYTADEAGCSDGTGQCSVTPETVLADDSHQWWIRTWNPSGNGPWSDLSFTVDTSIGTEVILDAAGNVTGIENLPVADEFGEDTLYNVDFVYSTAIDIYGEILDFDFTEEDVFPALLAVNKALNENDPVPVGAGPQGSNQFFIGADEENDLVEAVGGENIEGVWDQCETDCSAGVTLLAPIFSYTYAVFTELDLD